MSSTIYVLTHLYECPLVNCVTLDTWHNIYVYELLIVLSIACHNLTIRYCKY
jgi:queuine/archaeosine tRNA-ribosyltransferase